MKSKINNALRAVALLSLAAGIACKSETKEPSEKAGEAGEPGAHAAAPSGVKLTGDTVKVEIYSDAVGNYFKPNDLHAKQGDVVRFTLKSGVHNVHFLPDSNTVKTGLPPASDLLQLPDQTYDLVVSLAEGKYYFQCDPHAALGMKGHLEVKEK